MCVINKTKTKKTHVFHNDSLGSFSYVINVWDSMPLAALVNLVYRTDFNGFKAVPLQYHKR